MKLSWYWLLSIVFPSKKMRYKRDEYKNKLSERRKRLNALINCIGIKKIRMVHGGWNVGFIVNNKYVYKTRDRDISDISKIIKEKRIIDAFTKIVPLKIPNIDIIHCGKYIFCRYEFIPGKNLTKFSLKTIMKYREKWATQIAQFIFAMHTHNPKTLVDLKSGDGDSWGHNDICNNMIVDTKTMTIVGLIDWEYAGWNFLETEFKNCTAFSPKLLKAGLDTLIRQEYIKLKH